MSAWKAIVAAIVIFVAGCATGALAARLFAKPPSSSQAAQYPPAMGMSQRLEYTRRLETRLNLTREQKDGVEAALRDSQEHMKTLWESISPDMRRELQTARDKIQALLTPEQLVKYQEMMKARPGRKFEEGKEPHRDWRRGGEFSGRGSNLPASTSTNIFPRPVPNAGSEDNSRPVSH